MFELYEAVKLYVMKMEIIAREYMDSLQSQLERSSLEQMKLVDTAV